MRRLSFAPWPLREFLSHESGAAAIEAAIIMPFLILLGAGVFEYGNVMYNQDLIQNGVRDAARYLTRVRDLTDDEKTMAKQIALSSVGNASSAAASWWQADQIKITVTPIPNGTHPATGQRLYRSGDNVRVIRVETATSYPGMGMLRVLGRSSLTLSAAHEERYVGQ